MVQKRFRIELDTLRRRLEAARHPVFFLSVFAIAGCQWHAYALWGRTQLFERDATRMPHGTEASIHVAVPEIRAQPKPTGKIKDNIGIRTRGTLGLDDRSAKLNQFGCVRAYLKSNFQTFSLKWCGEREEDVGKLLDN